jgi:hypothetical protein
MPEWPESHTPKTALYAGIYYYDKEIEKVENRLEEIEGWIEQKRAELALLKESRQEWVDAKNRLIGDA